MDTIVLGHSGQETTRLGYGCSSLMGALGRRDSLALLEAAFEAGLRHFDVAPMYGYGQAESCLGDFVRRHPGQITIATKYGIPPAKNRSLVNAARTIIGPVVRRFPALKKRIVEVANAATANTERVPFTAEQASLSFQRSLEALKTDHIDLWLLHEVEAEDLQDDRLLRLLEDTVKAGTIGTFGVGSGGGKIPKLLQDRPGYCPVLQYEWSILSAAVPEGSSFRIHHSALTNNFRSLHASLVREPDRCRRWSENTGVDLAHPEALAQLMLKAALVFNPGSIILFSSKHPQHMQANVRVADDRSMELPARRLYDLVQKEQADVI